jgi:XTP/dITP diphosphohydrolase
MSPRIFYIATKNAHKRDEILAIIAAADPSISATLDLRLCSDLPGLGEWVEDGATFEENAAIKAREVRAHTRAAVLADDSGLVVDALDGAPGIHSARYAEGRGDAANNEKLLAALNSIPEAQRSARFVCVLCMIDEDGREFLFRGECAGRIGHALVGSHGFGYDPLFLVDGCQGRSMAELAPAEKNQLSHRGQAVRRWLNGFSRPPAATPDTRASS